MGRKQPCHDDGDDDDDWVEERLQGCLHKWWHRRSGRGRREALGGAGHPRNNRAADTHGDAAQNAAESPAHSSSSPSPSPFILFSVIPV